MEQKIRMGIQSYLTPMLILIVGYLLNDKIGSVDRRLERLETGQETLIEVRQRVNDIERRVEKLEGHQPAKHEEIFSLDQKQRS